MSTRKISGNIYIVDLKPHNIERFTASYILQGRKIAIIECGPAASSENLLKGLKALHVDFEKVEYIMVTHAHIDHWGESRRPFGEASQCQTYGAPTGVAPFGQP